MTSKATPQMSFNLKKFDMKSMPQDAVVVFIGRRRTGKSTLVRDVLFHHRNIPLGTVISGTEESNSFYGKIIPPLFIHGEYSPVILANFVKRQKLIMQRIQREEEQMGAGKSRIDPRSFMILDDCMYNDDWTRDKNISYIFMNGRHLKVFFLVTMQYPLGIQPALRTNVDFAFILRSPFQSDRKKIYENYGAAFPSFEFFCQVMDQCTQNFECLVINNTSLSNRLDECIFWYKAELHGDFRIGAPEFWEQSKKYYRDDEEEEHMNQYDPTAATKLKGPVIKINKK
jgi:hypothetical protein